MKRRRIKAGRDYVALVRCSCGNPRCSVSYPRAVRVTEIRKGQPIVVKYLRPESSAVAAFRAPLTRRDFAFEIEAVE